MLRRGRCFALCTGSWSDLIDKHLSNCPTLLFLYKLTVGRVKLNFLKMKKSMFTAFAVGLCLSANVMAQVPSYVPTNGLVGWWPFNGNANDESGNGNNGTVNGATLTTDRFGNANKAFSFDGVNDFIDLGVNPLINNLTQNYTFSFFILKNDLNSSMILANVDPSIAGGWRILLRTTINFESSFRNSTNWYSAYSNQNTITPNNWIHLVCVRDNSIIKIYVNGILNSTTNVGFLNPNTYPNAETKLGKHWVTINNNYEYINGKLDDLGAWNRSLSDCEIADLYNAQINSVAGSVNISSQPALIGSTSILSTASQSQNIQWQSNPSNFGWQNVPSNANYLGGATNTLTVSNVQLSNHNQPFRAIVNEGGCIDTSNVAQIIIGDTCLTTVIDTLIINTTLSLPAPNNENTILIYPNPASDHITIDNGNYTAMVGYTIKIENNAGQQVFQSLINQAQFYVDLSTWSGNGLYFVHLIDAQGNTVTVRKIVLQ